MVLFDLSTPRAFAWQSLRNAKIDVKKIIRVTNWGTTTGEIEVLYVTPKMEAYVAYLRPDGKVSGSGLPW